MLSPDNLCQLSVYVHETGRNLENSSGLASLEEIIRWLPDNSEYEYQDDLFSLKINGNVNFHTDSDCYDATLFILTDKIYAEEQLHPHCYLIHSGGREFLRKGTMVIFDHSKEHAIMCNHAWAGIAIPLSKKRNN